MGKANEGKLRPETAAEGDHDLLEVVAARLITAFGVPARDVESQLAEELQTGTGPPDPRLKIRRAIGHLRACRALLRQVVDGTPASAAGLPPEADLPDEADAVEVHDVVACVLHDWVRPAIDDLLAVAGRAAVDGPSAGELAGTGPAIGG